MTPCFQLCSSEVQSKTDMINVSSGKIIYFSFFSLFSLVLLSLRKYIIFPPPAPHAVFSTASEIRTSNMKNDLKRDAMGAQMYCGLSGDAHIYGISYFSRIIFCNNSSNSLEILSKYLISALFSLNLQCKSLPGRWYEMSLSICITFTIDRILWGFLELVEHQHITETENITEHHNLHISFNFGLTKVQNM